MDANQRFQLLLTGLAVAGTLIGVLGGTLLGGWLDRRIRLDERKDAKASGLRETAAGVLGAALNHLVSINPSGNVGMAEGLDVDDVIDTLRGQANDVRPALMRLSIQWPERRKDLIELAFYIRWAPSRLALILRQVREGQNPDDLSDFGKLVTDTQKAMDLWNAVVAALDE